MKYYITLAVFLIFLTEQMSLENDELKDRIVTQKKKLMETRKELFTLKRKEDDYLEVINAKRSHSRQVSKLDDVFEAQRQKTINDV